MSQSAGTIATSPIFIAPKNVANVVSMSRSMCDRLEAEGLFPKKISLSPGRKAWRYSDLVEWAEQRIAAANRQNPESK